jgi:hypothetical protein
MSAGSKASQSAFSPMTMIIMVLVGIVCLAGIAILSAFEPEMKSGNDGQAHALSKSSVGYWALTRLMQESDYEVDLNRRGIDEEDHTYSTVVIAPNPGVAAEEILEFYREGPTVIILPKWFVIRSRVKRGWSELIETIPTPEVIAILPSDLRGASKLEEAKDPVALSLNYSPSYDDSVERFGTTKPISYLRTISGPKWKTIIPGPKGGAVIAKHNDYNVYVVADPDIFNNAGIGQSGNAKLAETFFLDIMHEEDETPLIFDLTLNGFQRTPNLGRLMIQPPLLGATLCMLLAAILIALQAATRFLPPKENVRVVALGKRALADNTAGLIRMGRREHHMALPYANMMKRIAIKAVGAPANLDPVAQTAMLDRVSELSNSQLRFSELVGDAGGATNPQDLVKIAQDLHRWKQETTRERH